MSDTDTQTNPIKPMSHAERGRLGGQAKGATKGFGTPAVSAKAVAKIKAQAEERKAKVKAITDQWQGPRESGAVEPIADPAEDLQPYISKPFRSALDVPAEITVIE